MNISRGFTLVEVMVAVSLIAILAAVGAPLTAQWTTSAEQTSAKGVMAQAVGRAKALAMRNQFGINEDKSAAAICLSNTNQVQVLTASSTITSVNCGTGGGVSTWQSTMGSSLSFKVAGSTLSCLCFDTKGKIINTSASSCNACAGSTDITISANGVSDDTFTLY